MSKEHQQAFDQTVHVERSFVPTEPARCGVTGELIDFNRYIVVKRDNLNYLSQHKQNMLAGLLAEIRDARKSHGLKEEPWRVVISEGMDCYPAVLDLLAAELRVKSGVAVQDRLIRTPLAADLLLVAKTFLGSRVHINMAADTGAYNGAELLIPQTNGNFRDGALVPWNPWNDPQQALELSVLIRARLSCDVNGPCVEYWDEPLTNNEADGHPNGEIMRSISCMQHEESGFSLAFARKVTQVAVYRAHRIQGTI